MLCGNIVVPDCVSVINLECLIFFTVLLVGLASVAHNWTSGPVLERQALSPHIAAITSDLSASIHNPNLPGFKA